MERKYECGYCGRSYTAEGDILIFRSEKDPELYICQHCVETCYEALELTLKDVRNENTIMDTSLTPSQMKKHFDDYIINQERAKKILAVAVYNHYKRTFYNNNIATDMKLKKSNVLMVGPSGTGKTLFVETMAKKLGVPFTIADATSLTQAGLTA